MAGFAQIEARAMRVVQKAAARRQAKPLDAARIMFAEQLAFVDDDSKHATAVCSRRAGKTVAAAGKLIKTAQKKRGCVCLYLALTRLNAKRIVWRTLLDLNAEWGLGAKANETELRLDLPNGSTIYLAGANDKGEIEKYRGLALALVVIDEAQSFPAYIEELVDAVITPALMDYDGALALVGTPGPVEAGYFYKCATSPGWAHFSWTVFDNPHIEAKSKKNPRQHLDEELKRRGVAEDDPLIQREWWGKWRADPNSLVFRYDAKRNALREIPAVNGWQYVVGVDLGYDDADAIAVLGWSDDDPGLYLVEEQVVAKQGITALAEQLRAVEAKYRPLAWVADFGGLGKKIAIEVTARTGIPLEAADKERKLEHIELLNDALRTGRFFARPDGRFAQDCLLVEWDRTNPEKPKISDRYHSDQCDAVLYAFRRSLHWQYAPSPEAPAVGTPAHFERQAQDYQRDLEERYERERAEAAVDTNGGWGWQ